MATPTSVEDKSRTREYEESDKTHIAIDQMIKKNGFNSHCYCGEKSSKSVDCNLEKPVKLLRVNGAGFAKIAKPSIPTLRSRKERKIFYPEEKRKRRPSRQEKTEAINDASPEVEVPVSLGLEDRIADGKGTAKAKYPKVCKESSLSNNNCDSGTPCVLQHNSDKVNNNAMCTCTTILPGITTQNQHQGKTQGGGQRKNGSNKNAEDLSERYLRQSSTSTSSTDTTVKTKESKLDAPVACKWVNCRVNMEIHLLMDHIRDKHVETQKKNSEGFVCLWESCKVFNKPSCSFNWLERHILSHSGAKPFRCIVDGCGMRFTSQTGLERHVNSHFNTYPSPQPKTPRSTDNTPTKSLKKKKRDRRKRPRQIKTADYFDSCTLAGIRHQMINFSQKTQLDINGSGDSVTFHSTVICKRTEESGKSTVLLHWRPEDVLPDEWVPEPQAASLTKRTIPINELPRETVTQLDSFLYRKHRFRKHRK